MIELIYSDAKETEKIEGLTWYGDAQQFCRELSEEFDVEFFKVCGILSALSPRKKWEQNKKAAYEFLATGKNVAFGQLMNKCHEILACDNAGEVLIILNGLKIQSFFINIYNREHSAVTIDVWMIRLLGITGSLTPKRYYVAEKAIQVEATKRGYNPSDFQAILWTVIRNNWENKYKNIFDNLQAA